MNGNYTSPMKSMGSVKYVILAVKNYQEASGLIYDKDRNMEQYEQNLAYTDEEKVITYCKNIIKAVEKTRDVAARSKLKSRKIEEALQTKDKQTMWNVLQEYI